MDVDGDIDLWQFPEPIIIEVDQLPIARFSVNTTQIIIDQAVKCLFLGDFGNSPVEFQWNFGDNEYSYERDPTHIYNQIGVFNISLMLKDANNDTDWWSYPDIIVIHPDLTPLAIFTINATEIFTGQSIQCNFTGSYGNLPVIFWWDFGENQLSEEEHPIHTYNEEGIYSIILKVTDQDGDISIKYMEILVQETTKIHFETIILLSGIPIGVFGVITVGYRYLRKPKSIPLTRMKI
jgi:PKD repeat protein